MHDVVYIHVESKPCELMRESLLAYVLKMSAGMFASPIGSVAHILRQCVHNGIGILV